MSRTKADFEALRESLGMSQSFLAGAICVTARSVKRWGDPNSPQTPPEDAWECLESFRAGMDRAVLYALRRALSSEQELGEKPTIDLTYWSSEDEWLSYHEDDPGDWRMANATSRAIANELRDRGFAVRFSFVGDSAAADAARLSNIDR
jgi:hypothetical protein